MPGLVTVLVGEDPASQVYVRSKGERCREVGMESFHESLPATASQAEVLDAVDRWNADDRVDGILVQAPLPEGLDFKQVLDRIDPGEGRRRLPPAQRRPAGGQPARRCARARRPA